MRHKFFVFDVFVEFDLFVFRSKTKRPPDEGDPELALEQLSRASNKPEFLRFESIDEIVIRHDIPRVVSLVLDAVEMSFNHVRRVVAGASSLDAVDHPTAVHHDCLAAFWRKTLCRRAGSIWVKNVSENVIFFILTIVNHLPPFVKYGFSFVP